MIFKNASFKIHDGRFSIVPISLLSVVINVKLPWLELAYEQVFIMLYHLVFVVCIRQNMATGVCTQTVQSKRRDMCMSAEPSQSVSVGEAQPFIRIIIQISWLIYQSRSISHRHAWQTDQTYGSRSGFILFAYVQRSYLLTGHKRVFCCECDLSNTSNYKHYTKRIQLNHLWAWDSVSDDHSLDERLDNCQLKSFLTSGLVPWPHTKLSIVTWR